MAKKKKKKKKSLKKRIRQLKRKIVKKLQDAYYINRFYKCPVKENTVLIESKHGEDVAGNMFYILKQFSSPEYKDFTVYLAATKENFPKFQKLFSRYDIDNVILIEEMSFGYLKVLATAKYLFNDTSFPLLFIKRKEQVYTNTWHGTPLKHMGNDVADRRYAMGNIMRNFMMTDYLVYPNGEMKDKMTSSYFIDKLSNGKILRAGYPRNAVFFNKERANELKRELGLENKHISVYMPTWRGVMTDRNKDEQFRSIIESLRVLDKMLDDNYVFFVKMHVLVQTELDFSAFKHIRAFPEGYETYDVLNTADVLVSDYSSVFFDFANTGKKIVLYTYDREEYTSGRGMYYDLDDFPFPKVYTPEELVGELKTGINYDGTEFNEKFCTYDNPCADSELVKFVVKGEASDYVKCENARTSNKENVLIYSGSLALNGITSSLVSLTEIIDLKKDNIFVSFREKSVKRDPLRPDKFSKDVNIFPLINGFKYSFTELIAYALYYKFSVNTGWVNKKLDRLYERELVRFYGYSHFDRAIQFMGYEYRVIGMYQRFKIPKAIFVHNDMCQEISSKGNQKKIALQSAYKNYDRVVCVTEDVKESCLKLTPGNDHIVIVNNAHNYKNIQEKMKLPVAYDEKTVSNVSLNVLNTLLSREDYIKFINIGRFSPEKGHKRLIDAFNRFYLEHPKSYLFIIGGYGKTWREINSYIRTKDCRFNVILIRYISNPFAVLKQCDLFILSSFYEALGLVALEAQTCGVPVISTDISGPRGFMLSHGGTLVENSEQGIYDGMNAFMRGEVKMMDFDPQEYNNNIKTQYENIFK